VYGYFYVAQKYEKSDKNRKTEKEKIEGRNEKILITNVSFQFLILFLALKSLDRNKKCLIKNFNI